MNRNELFDKLLKHLCENKDGFWGLISTSEQYFNVTDEILIESIVDEMIERDWVTESNYDKFSVMIKYDGQQVYDKYGSYSSFLCHLKKSNNKKLVQKSTDRKLNNISKICTIIFGFSAFILSYYKIIDNKKIGNQKTEIIELNKTIDSLKTEFKKHITTPKIKNEADSTKTKG